jgi:CRISPR/Cas system-associated protein endoribonuclease Cas2
VEIYGEDCVKFFRGIYLSDGKIFIMMDHQVYKAVVNNVRDHQANNSISMRIKWRKENKGAVTLMSDNQSMTR